MPACTMTPFHAVIGGIQCIVVAVAVALLAFSARPFKPSLPMSRRRSQRRIGEADDGVGRFSQAVEVLRFLGLKRGDRALDLFGSGGYYGEIMAARWFERIGRCLGGSDFIDPKREKDWAALRRLVPNVKLLVSPASRIRLPQNTYDFVMFNLNYHDLYWESVEYKFPKMDPKPFVRTLYASMKPGAILGVIDHVAAPGGTTREVAQKLHRSIARRCAPIFKRLVSCSRQNRRCCAIRPMTIRKAY